MLIAPVIGQAFEDGVESSTAALGRVLPLFPIRDGGITLGHDTGIR